MVRLLLVDDDANLRKIGQIALRRHFSVTMADGGQQALDLAKLEKPEVILLDVMMPRFDGIATLRALQSDQETANIPVIFLTAKILRHEVSEYMQLGIAGVISKPFDPLELPFAVHELLERSVVRPVCVNPEACTDACPDN
jgi:DNA-binding response OmpR family regulator